MRRLTPLLSGTMLVVGIALVALGLKDSVTRSVPLASFAESGVQVDLSVEQSARGQDTLVARYTPLRAHFHVYSKDLPPNGLDGMGRPTRLDVLSGFQIMGELTADQPVETQEIEALNAIFPVYPDGPVALRLPVKGEGVGQIKVSYMACSSSFGCLPPTERILTITLRH